MFESDCLAQHVLPLVQLGYIKISIMESPRTKQMVWIDFNPPKS